MYYYSFHIGFYLFFRLDFFQFLTQPVKHHLQPILTEAYLMSAYQFSPPHGFSPPDYSSQLGLGPIGSTHTMYPPQNFRMNSAVQFSPPDVNQKNNSPCQISPPDIRFGNSPSDISHLSHSASQMSVAARLSSAAKQSLLEMVRRVKVWFILNFIRTELAFGHTQVSAQKFCDSENSGNLQNSHIDGIFLFK